jgi:hypothetical protein
MDVRLAFLGLALSCASCVPAKGNLRPDTHIDPTEGIVVATMSCGPQVYWGEWYGVGKRSKGYVGALNHEAVFQCNQGLQVVAMKEGSYFLGKVGGATFLDYPEAEALAFRVTAGKVNYAGHFMVPSVQKERQILVGDTLVADRSEETQSALRRLYPWMTQKYEFLKATATRPATKSPAPSARP